MLKSCLSHASPCFIMRPFWRKFRKFPFLGGGLDAQQLRSMAGSDMFRVESQEDWRLLPVSKNRHATRFENGWNL